MDEISVKQAKKLYKQNDKKIVDQSINSFICLRGVDKVYPNKVQAVFGFDLDVDKNDFVALVGPSGCGKSTTLRMIAGLEEISDGHLYIDGVMANYLPSKDRDIAMVFQNYALYPQLNVYDNIAFGLKIRRFDKKEIERRVFEAAKILDLGQYLDRKPKELSGGQMQRVALGRAIVRHAKLFLMDEPLSNLDAKLRVQMRSEIVRIHEEVGATTIYVTHDQTEAMTMANKIVVMNKGFVQQVGAPLEIYHDPQTLFVATFIGTPPMNIVDCEYDSGALVFPGGGTHALKAEVAQAYERFIADRLNELNAIIDGAERIPTVELRNYLLYLAACKYRPEKKSAGLERPKKDRFYKRLWKRIANNFIVRLVKKIRAGKADDSPERAEYIQKLTELADSYRVAQAGRHPIKVGIRPENIRISNDGEFSARADLVEILGSEFIAYTSGELGAVTVKSLDPVEAHKDVRLAIDFDKLHIFDAVSEQNALRAPAYKLNIPPAAEPTAEEASPEQCEAQSNTDIDMGGEQPPQKATDSAADDQVNKPDEKSEQGGK